MSIILLCCVIVTFLSKSFFDLIFTTIISNLFPLRYTTDVNIFIFYPDKIPADGADKDNNLKAE